jgi:D-alanine-D-alanine ligase
MPWSSALAAAVGADIYFPALHGPNTRTAGASRELFRDGRQALLSAPADHLATGHGQGHGSQDAVRPGRSEAGLSCISAKTSLNRSWAGGKEAGLSRLRQALGALGSCSGHYLGAKDEKELLAAGTGFQRYDNKVVIEKAIAMREIEVSVMGNNEIMISAPGELLPAKEFYDYADKYLDGKTQFRIPVSLGTEIEARMRKTVQRAYRALFLNGFARVDLFLEQKFSDLSYRFIISCSAVGSPGHLLRPAARPPDRLRLRPFPEPQGERR